MTLIVTCYIIYVADGSIAQLGEHLPYKQRVTGSSPVVPTKNNTLLCVVFLLLLQARACEGLSVKKTVLRTVFSEER